MFSEGFLWHFSWATSWQSCILLCVVVLSLSTHICLWFFSLMCCTRQQWHLQKNTVLSLWDKLQERSRRIITPWTIWLASYLEAENLFHIRWPRLKVAQTSTQRGAGLKSPGTIDINPKNSRRKDIERKARTAFHLECHISSAEHSLRANIHHRCTKLLTTCFSLIILLSHISCRLFHFECVAG